ncbi:DUF5801 repeats-in-toxin domain-containing protein [Marinobacter sp.]|uniref:DUF5801 repeats-in-toxin domain-containing protein n=1 Tax=Marinobacter sp. TaxID=50741 RepID=UPI003A8EED0F
MTTLATVVSLVGQAWAENANGERRVLEVGDQLAIDETLVLERGARVNLDFGDNQQLTFLGEQQVTAEERANLVEQSESLAPLESNDQPITDSPTQSSQGTFSEGHGFVQLVRIGEIIEADGFTPVTVARIHEVLRPLGLSLPQRELENGFRDEHLANRNDEYLGEVDLSGGNNDQPGDSGQEPDDGGEQPGGDEQPGDGDQPDNGDEEPGDGGDRPELSISIDVIADDDIISAAEAEQTVTLTGTVGGDAQPGDKVTITVNGKVYETTVNPDGKTWQTEVPGSELVQDRTVEATVTRDYDEDGPLTADAERPYGVEVTKPILSIELEGAGPEGIYSESEISNGKVPAKVTLDKDTVKVGDLLQVKTPNGGVLLERPVTQENIDNGVRVQVPVSPGQREVTVEASITDPVGNSSNDRDEKPIDTLPPLLTGALDPQNDQDADHINLDLSGKFSDTYSGSNLIYSAANLPGGLTIDPGTGVISGRIHSSASQTGNIGNGEYEVTITVSDPAGNSTQHSFTWTVTNPAPTAADDSGSTDEDTPLVVNPRNGVLKNDVDPDGDQLFVTGIVAGGSKPTNVGGLDTDIVGDYGTLKLQADGSYTYVPDKTNPDVRALKDGETLEDIFSYTMTDREGGADDATLVITINGVSDSEPTIIPKDENGPDDPNDIITAGHATVYESGLIADTPTQSKTVEGEIIVTALDGLISVKVHGQTFDLTQLADLENTAVVLDTDYGKLTLDGFTQDEVDSTIVGGELSYRYELDTRFDNAAPGLSGDQNGFDSIALEVLDAGNTSKNGTLEINIIDDEPAVSEKTVTHAVEVDETTLGVPSTAVSFADAFDTAYGADGAASSNGLVYSFEIDTTLATGLIDTATGENIELTISATGEVEGRTESGDLAFTVRVDSANGEVTLTQARALKHPDKANPDDAVSLVENTLKLKATATDGDGDENSASISLGDKLVFKDDGPAIEVEAGFTAPEVIVDETSLGTPSSAIAFAGAFVAPDYGEDGAASTDALVYSLDIDPAIVTGLTDTATGQAIVLSINGSGEVEGRTDTDGELAFIANVDSNTGKVTLTQSRALSHPDTSDHDDAVSLAENALSLKATATDGDGDEASASISLGDKLVFKDDGPAIDVESGFTAPEVIVDETSLGTPSSAIAFAGAFKAPDYGADGAASTDALVYSLDIDSAKSTGLIDTATGKAIVLSINGSGEVEGRTDVGGNLAFTISVNSDGEVTLTQSRSMQHTDTDDPDDEVTIASGTIQLHATAVDGDGDMVKSDGVDIGGQFTFKDDGPTIDGSEVGGDGYVSDNTIVDERYLASGSESDPSKLIVGKNLPIDFGADGAVNAVGDIGLTFNNSNLQALSDLNLKSGTTELAYTISGDGHTVEAKAGSKDIFSIELKVASDGAPSYEFVLKGPLDHILNVDGETADNIILPFDITATDGDGDSVDLKFKVEVVDDTPAAGDRDLEVNEDGSVSFSNADVNQVTTEIKSGEGPQHGTVTIGNDGTITYEPHEDYRGDDSYTYTVTTASGSYERTVNVTVKPVADKPLFADRSGNYPDDSAIDPDGSLKSGDYSYSVETPEDVPIALGLHVPKVKDDGIDPDNNGTSELLGAINLEFKELTGVSTPELQLTDGTVLSPNGSGGFQFVIVDNETDKKLLDWHLDIGLPAEDTSNGVHYLTEAQYEGLQVQPPAERHENFKTEVSVDSYEVDAQGEQLAGVNGATSTQTIDVIVKAVTDPIELKVDTDKDAHTYEMDEDTTFNLKDKLTVNYPDNYVDGRLGDDVAGGDLDGSETRWFEITGLPKDTVVNGTTVTGPSHVISIEAPGLSTSDNGLPDINITPPKDFSGDLKDITVTLKAQDKDSDAGDSDGLIEVDSITLELQVNPVAGDLVVEGTEGLEDEAIAFLENIRVTDDSTASGTLGEVITEVSFTVPTGWTRDAGQNTWSNTDGQTWTMAPSTSGGWTGNWNSDEYTITFTDSNLTTSQREDILKEFTVTSPAHSSKDIDLEVKVTSVDHSISSTGSASDPASQAGTLTVEVEPVAESAVTDSDNANGNDVTMGGNHVYQTSGEEDGWLVLGDETSTGFKLSNSWSNEDGKWVYEGGSWKDVSVSGDGSDKTGRSEDTFALLTPYTTVNNDAQAGAVVQDKLEGSVFTYEGPSGTVTLPFAGEPVKIPMQYLDSVQFKGPADWSGVVKIKVQAGTIDYDEDDGTATDLAESGESWLTNLIIEPRADQVTLQVDTPLKTQEDEAVTLSILPTSSDKDETFDVTISKIPKGVKITYDGVEYDTLAGPLPDGLTDNGDGTYTLEIEGFDTANQPELTPPKDSNEEINLTVKAESVDTLEYINNDGYSVVVEHKGNTVTTKVYGNGTGSAPTSETTETVASDTSQELPIRVEVQGVPDEPKVTIDNTTEYWEDGAEESSGQGAAPGLEVDLKDLVTGIESGETGVENAGPDSSETISLRISDLPEGFTLTGAGPQLGAGSGPNRLWVISKDDLNNVKIGVPEHYSGTVEFTVQPVVTENDNPSNTFFDKENVSFKVKPVAEASLSLNSDLVEDTVGELNLTALGADGDEYISEVRISEADVTNKELTLYADAAGTTELSPVGGVYTVINSDPNGVPSVYVKGPANHSGDISLSIGYTVADPVGDGSTGIPNGTKTGSVNHTLSFAAVTDEIGAALNGISDNATGTSFTYDSGTKTATIEGSGKVTVTVDISQLADTNAGNETDTDGSEQLTHIQIEGVPQGVSVEGAESTGEGKWLIETADSFNSDTLIKEIVFNVTGHASSDTSAITITSYTKDTGAKISEKAQIDWNLVVNQSGTGVGELPQITLTDKQKVQDEDSEFALSDQVDADLSGGDLDEYNITVTLRTSPDDETEFTDGNGSLTRTEVTENGETVVLWTKTTSVAQGDNAETKLNDLLDSIKVHTPEHANANNLSGNLPLDVTVSVHANGVSKKSELKPEVELTPVTDETTVTVTADAVGEGEDIPVTIELENTADGSFSNVSGNNITVTLGNTGLAGELLYANGDPLTSTGANTYEVGLIGGQPPQLIFRPDSGQPHQTGSLELTASVTTTEQGASNSVTATGNGSLVIGASNSGYKADITAEGNELNEENTDLIQLNFANAGLVDAGEQIESAFISDLPVGFTVWVGGDMANNAGGGIWAIPLAGNDLPANISIKPPKNWAGTLDDLKFTVMSGHAGLEPSASAIDFDLVVNPTPNGVDMNPTLSFGDAGDKISLNLNASMKDPSAATGAKDGAGNPTDQFTELTELSVSGFPDGEKVLFFIGNEEEPLGAAQATFDSTTSTWIINGLSQSDLQNLKFLHAEGSGSLTVKGRTYEVDVNGIPYQEGGETKYSSWSGDKAAEINISQTVPTSGDDHFLWDESAINGFGGEDTVQLRFSDDLGSGDFSKLENIEMIDMKGSGPNQIGDSGAGLNIQDVLDITDSRNALKIDGDGDDFVFLKNSEWTTDNTVTSGYVTYTSSDTSATLNISDQITSITMVD